MYQFRIWRIMKNYIKRIIIAFLLATMIMIPLLACIHNTSIDSVETNNGFVVVSNQEISGDRTNGKYLTIMYDPDTLVMYTVTFGEGRDTSQLTPLYNADGTLKTYTPNTESN